MTSSVQRELAGYSRAHLLEVASLLNPDGLPSEISESLHQLEQRPTPADDPQLRKVTAAIADELQRAQVPEANRNKITDLLDRLTAKVAQERIANTGAHQTDPPSVAAAG